MSESDWRPLILVGAVLYAVAAAYLLATGHGSTVLWLSANGAYLVAMMWVTARVTRPGPAPVERRAPAPTDSSGRRAWAQLAVVLVVVLLTSFAPGSVPGWSALVGWFHRLGDATLPAFWFGGPGNAVANPFQYFVAPLALLLLLGARLPQLGLGRGHRVRPATQAWLAVPVVVLGGMIAVGAVSGQLIARRVIANAFQNGFFEEFLFRGALQTRLQRFLSVPAALGVQALGFGLWHLRANTAAMGGDVAAGLALCVVSQAVAGLAFGYLFLRTHNLVVPSIAHVAMNVLGQSVG
jgi:membrane protease YdiL (CAAX protease family)